MKIRIAALLAMAPLTAAAQPEPTAESSVDVTLERMQSMIHHAVASAAEGARLIAMADQADESGVDSLAVGRGREMLAEARDLIVEVASGEAMMQLHTLELTDEQGATMIATHRLEQAATAYINVTEQTLAPDAAAAPP